MAVLILVRKTTLDAGTVVGQSDVEFRKAKLSIGTRPESDVTLYGEGMQSQHCEVEAVAGGAFKLQCARGATVSLTGAETDNAQLKPGEHCSLGPHRLLCIKPPPGFDAALDVEIDAEASASAQQRYADDIQLPMPSLRALAWLGLLLVLGAGLLLPMLTHYQPSAGSALAAAGLPTDHFWLSGPLDSAHQLAGIGDDCSSCHVKAFAMVSDATCVGCHTTTPGHFAADHPDWADAGLRCAGCHREHNEPGNLVIGHDGVCTDCHAENQRRFVETDVRSDIATVTAFSPGQHPEFLLSMLQPDQDVWSHQRQLTIADNPAEQSNLKFPHDVHLDAEKVHFPGKQTPLACADCHVLNRDGEHFRPITMEASCAGCHSLAFDPDQPDREMSHALPAVVYRELQEYYIARAAAELDGEPRMRNLRRAPGKPEAVKADNSQSCRGSVRACGLRMAAEEMQRLFEHTGCVTCHEVNGAGSVWSVEPVRLNEDWYASSDFDHRPHLNAALAETDEQCLSCHAAHKSEQSSDVLIPGVDNCLQCHNSAAKNSSKLMCLECHGFHESEHGLMRPVVSGSAGAMR